MHLERIPEKLEFENKKLEEDFKVALEAISAILGARDSAKIGTRWPVKTVILDVNEDLKKSIEKSLKWMSWV